MNQPETHVPINSITLTCGQCGSGAFTKVDDNEYQCTHCGAITLVEDDVARRLESILKKIQMPATPAAPVAAKPKAAVLVAVGIMVFAALTFAILTGSFNRAYVPATTTVDQSKLVLSDLRDLRPAKPALLVMMHNETGTTISAPEVRVTLFNDQLTQGEVTGRPLLSDLLPGEYTPVLIDLDNRTFTRYTVAAGTARRTDRQNVAISAQHVQLVRDDGGYRLLGTLSNGTTTDARTARVLAMLYAADAKLIGTCDGYAVSTRLPKGQASNFDASCDVLEPTAIASYEYLVSADADYGDARPTRSASTEASASRLTKVAPAAAREVSGLRLTTEEWLDPGFALFDATKLRISKPMRMIDEIGRPFLLAEVENTSTSETALSPSLDTAFFDGHAQLRLKQQDPLPSRLAPGAKAPVMFSGENFARYSEMKATWTPMKQASAGKAPTNDLEVSIESSDSGIGTGTLNFTSRYQYKYIDLNGRISNRTDRRVDRARVWITLYDAQGKITGMKHQDISLPKLAPGENAPFKANVKQYGENTARISVVAEAAG